MLDKVQKPHTDYLLSSLFHHASDDVGTYAVIDGYWCPDIYPRLLAASEELEWCGLIAGEQAQELALTSPYLVRLEPDHKLTRWLLEEGWGPDQNSEQSNGWGMYFNASKSRAAELYRKPPPETLAQQTSRGAFVHSPGIEADTATDIILLRRHFRHFLRVEWESDGRIVRFRFFDPAVLRVYLHSCNAAELTAFLGPIDHIFAEDWCEEASLNNPQNLWHFQRPSETSPMLIRKINMNTREITYPKTYEASTETLTERPKGLLTVIRTGQEKLFEAMQLEIFYERVAQDLIEVAEAEGRGKGDVLKAREFVREQIEAARSYELETEYDLKGYVFCAWRLGSNFTQTHEEAKTAFADKTLLKDFFLKQVYKRGEN